MAIQIIDPATNNGEPGAPVPMSPPLPLRPVRLGQTQRPWSIVDNQSLRPGYNLTPSKLFAAYRQAELGAPMLQCDVFEDVLENDGHLRGQYESRLSAVAFRRWKIRSGGADEKSLGAAKALSVALKRANMLPLLWHLMQAIGFGYSGANIVWGVDEKQGPTSVIVPTWFLLAPHRRFLMSLAGALTFRTPNDEWPGEQLYYGEWIISQRPHRQIVRAGAFRTTTWWALFKRMSVTDWIVFAEKFGIPFVIGSYEERASDASRAALFQAVQDIGSDGQAVLSDATKIVVENGLMRSGDVEQLHPAVIARCDAEISKVITGATLNVETGGPGSFALGKVHENRAQDITEGDAMWVQDIFQRHVIAPFVEYNPQFAGCELPSIEIDVNPTMGPVESVGVFGKLQVMGVKLSSDEMYTRYGLQRPAEGDELKPTYAAPTDQAPNPTAKS